MVKLISLARISIINLHRCTFLKHRNTHLYAKTKAGYAKTKAGCYYIIILYKAGIEHIYIFRIKHAFVHQLVDDINAIQCTLLIIRWSN